MKQKKMFSPPKKVKFEARKFVYVCVQRDPNSE